jgi:hypothetical protein
VFPYVLPFSIHPYLIFDVWNTIPLKTIPNMSNRIALFVQMASGLFGLLPIVFRLSALVGGLPELEFVNVQKKSKLQYHCPTISQIEISEELANMSLIPPDI